MKIKISLALFVITLNIQTVSSQNMAVHKYKTLKQGAAMLYIKEHHGQKKLMPNFPTYIIAYECDGNTLIIENTREKDYTLYYDREKYYKGFKEVEEVRNIRPLEGKQNIVKSIEAYKDSLLDQLYTTLAIPKPSKITDVDLKAMDKQIKLYGYENAYAKLYLNLIIFCGEYVKVHKGGGWAVAQKGGEPDVFEPIYVDSSGEKYGFMINTLLAREYTEHRRMGVSKIIFSAMLPKIFEVVPNPTLTNPNAR